MIHNKISITLIFFISIFLLFFIGCHSSNYDVEIDDTNIPQVSFTLSYGTPTANDINIRVWDAVEELKEYNHIVLHITMTGVDWKGNYLKTELKPYTISKHDMKYIAGFSETNYKYSDAGVGSWILLQNGYYR